MTTTEQTPAAGSWALVEAAKGGDEEAFGQLYRDYAAQVSGYVSRRLRSDRALVEDLTSETFLRAWRRIDTAHNNRGRDVGSWLTTIARNLLTDHHKSARVRYESVCEELPEQGRADGCPEQQVMARADHEGAVNTARRALAMVSPAQRQAIELYDLAGGRQLGDVAEEMGRSTSAVTQLRHSGLGKMRECLAAEGITSSQQCLEAVGRARRSVDCLTQQRRPPAAEQSMYRAPDRWAAESVSAAVGSRVVGR